MKILTASVLLTALLPVLRGGVALSTGYKTERAFRMEIETELKLETTTFERDGEPVDMPGGGVSSEVRRKEVHVDRVLEVKDGKPAKMRRTFESLGGKTTMTMGDNTRDIDQESPLEGVTLEIVRRGEDKIEVSAVEGGSPEGKALEGHLPDLFLDALLPAGDVAVDESWDLDSDAVRRALRLDVNSALFPRPEAPESGGEGGGGGRRRGMRGADAGLLSRAEWKGKAKLVATDHDVDGTICAVIELKLEASGDVPEPEPRAGGRGDRAFTPESTVLPASKSTYQIDLEGKFAFAMKERRPVSLDLEGTAKLERESEMTRGETTTRIHVVQEGEVKFKAAVSVEAAQGDK